MPLLQMLELDIEDGGLNGGQSEHPADHLVVVGVP